MGLITIVAVAVAAAAAVRSTWSPCGLSMLSTITPPSERGRGHRYATTAAWFVAGAVGGGLTLGLGAALLAGGVASIAPTAPVLEAAGAALALTAGAADAGVGGVRFPVFHRQVNERWLDQYRGWFYGAGFGWQVGVGVATYIMTAAVFLTVALAVVTGRPSAALLIGATFGMVRGLSVLLTRRLRTPEALRIFHRRFAAVATPVRLATIAVEVGGAVALAAAVWLPAGIGLAAAATVAAAAFAVRPARRAVQAGAGSGMGPG